MILENSSQEWEGGTREEQQPGKREFLSKIALW